MARKSSDEDSEKLLDPRKDSNFIRGTVDQIKKDWNLITINAQQHKKCCKKIKFKWVY